MDFSDYKKLFESNEEVAELAPGPDFSAVIEKIDPSKWNRLESDGNVYLAHNGRTLNMTKFMTDLADCYSKNGMAGVGFSRLSVEQAMKYKTLRSLISRFFEVDGYDMALLVDYVLKSEAVV